LGGMETRSKCIRGGSLLARSEGNRHSVEKTVGRVFSYVRGSAPNKNNRLNMEGGGITYKTEQEKGFDAGQKIYGRGIEGKAKSV